MERIEPKVPKDRKAVEDIPALLDTAFWDDEMRSLLAVLMPFLIRGAEAGVALQAATVQSLGVAVDWTMPYTEAATWARKHGAQLVTKMNRTTKKRLAGTVADWIESGDSLPALEKTLMKDHAFSRARAKLVAITETTDSFTMGELTAAYELEQEGFFEYEKEWMTVLDDLVCDICRPLHGVRVKGVKGLFKTIVGDVLGPSVHPGDRCWVNTIPVIPS